MKTKKWGVPCTVKSTHECEWTVFNGTGTPYAHLCRLYLPREAIRAFIEEFRRLRMARYVSQDYSSQYNEPKTSIRSMNNLMLDIEGKKGGRKPIPNHVSSLHILLDYYQSFADDYGEGSRLFTHRYNWGYNYKSERRVTAFEKETSSHAYSHNRQYHIKMSLIQKLCASINTGKLIQSAINYARIISNHLDEVAANNIESIADISAPDLNAIIHIPNEPLDAVESGDEEVLDEEDVSYQNVPIYADWVANNNDEEVFEDEDEDLTNDDKHDTKKGFEGLGDLFG